MRYFVALLPLCSRLTTLAAMVMLVGILPWLAGGDPALALLRARSGDQEATPETLDAIRHSLGLYQGPDALLWHWLKNLLQGDAGNSWISGAPVLPGMLQATGVSLTLMGCALLVALVLLSLICLPVLRAGLTGVARRPAGTLAAALTALPEFLLAALLLLVGAVWLGWLPPYGWTGWQHAILPALALGIPAGGLLGRLFSDALSASFQEKWLVSWQAAGIPHHHLALALIRRTLPAMLPQLAMVIIGLTGGAIAVEKVFAIPGLGRATLGAAAASDLPALQSGMLILLLLGSAAGLLANLLQRAILGPALKYGALPAVPPLASASRCGWWIPLIALLLILLLIAAGLPRDAFSSVWLRLQPPSWSLPFGADAMARDILARVAQGALHTCALALLVTLCTLLIGMLVGLFPRALVGPIEVANATPPVIAGMVIAAINGPTSAGAALAVIIVSWAPLAAHTAALVSEINAQPHIRMLPMLGVGPLRRAWRYLLPPMLAPLLRHAMLRLPGNALALAGLGFLGLGPQPPAADWGIVLAEGMPYVERAPWAVVAPALALILLSVLAVTSASLTERTRRLKI
ncbi:ABC transporter permease subunit [Erwiniaceae bacterium BAC15a-03b]|uniref:ABC transporter permease subunit n=1 Tax=Winslowiella arboricola TaxID=2978220 RepID=A0A9J6PI64_9GAMM|nr:ABC transporter permease subunit [Winslowiella arboricola]MCU5771198.1 ABC transporter permease subunit [Winslowiella arboricola]MCU5776163.1 ABC transporter permease subunit [Winslowiella arboricola]